MNLTVKDKKMELHGHDIEVGDKVWNVTYGEGVVQEIDGDHCPFLIKFPNKTYWMHKKEIFWQPFDIPAHAYQKPKKLVERGIIVFKRETGCFDCTIGRVTKQYFEKNMNYATFIRFVEETVEMVEE